MEFRYRIIEPDIGVWSAARSHSQVWMSPKVLFPFVV
jgi:hypothetical protein